MSVQTTRGKSPCSLFVLYLTHSQRSSPPTNCSPATLTGNLLDLIASRGNNPRSVDLTAGHKWCFCAARWKEAIDHAKSGDKGDVVPKVHLHAIHEKALEIISYEELKKFAAEPAAGNVCDELSSNPKSLAMDGLNYQ